MKYIKTDGSPVNERHCVMPDHWEFEFTVRIRTMTPISAARLENVIQDKFEVTECKRNDDNSTCIVR